MTAVTTVSTFGCAVHPAPTTTRTWWSARPTRRRHRVAAATYRRRRLVAAAVGISMLLVAGRAGAALGGAPLATPGARPHISSYVVVAGDTLWSIAQNLAPDTDPREVVDALVEARGTAEVMPGEAITWVREE